MSEKHISTSALARLLRKESRELFILLAQGGWMAKVDNHWQLTEKGKFEGGIYINHPKYGEYIAWPESVQEHPLLKLLPEAPLAASHLGAKLALPARLVNLILAERGWIKKSIRGWLLTQRGKAIGGEQHSSEQSGVPFVTWPETLLDHPHLLTAVAQISGAAFAQSAKALSGQLKSSAFSLVVENWLYLAGVCYACDYELWSGNESVTLDFFLPELQLGIDLWQPDDTAKGLAANLAKREFYKHHGYDFIELQPSAITQLDELLAKQLLSHGLAIY